VRVAWVSSHSYFSSYQFAHWALPIALVVIVVEATRLNSKSAALADARAWLTRPEHRAWFFVGAVAIVGFLSVHLLAKSNNRWYFEKRHNLVCIFVFFFALVFLLQSRRVVARLAGAAILVASVWVGGLALVSAARRFHAAPPQPEKPTVVAWLNAEHARLGRDFTVAFNQPQVVVWQTPGVHFHEVNVAVSTIDDVIYMTDHLGAEYLISPLKRKAKHRIPADRFAAEFVKVGSAPPFAIYRRVGATGPLALPAVLDGDDADDQPAGADTADAPQ